MTTSASSLKRLALLFLAALVALPAAADSGAQHRTKQTPPVKMGTSGGSAVDSSGGWCCGGTLGCLVRRDGVLNVLSNNHVLARSGSAVAGEDDVQPGLIDSGCRATASNIVGDFAGDLVPLGSANVDAALSVARSNVDATGAIIDVGVPCSSVQAAAIGLPVAKSGRTTGFTTGTVQAINANVQVQYQKGCNNGKRFNVVFMNQVVVGPGSFSAGGDSGSLIVSNDGTPNPVALLFAGSTSSTIGNPIQDVVKAFSAGGHTFQFVGGTCSGAKALDASSVGPSLGDLDLARRVKESREPELFARPGVIGAGVGVADNDPSEAVIIVWVQGDSRSRPTGFPEQLDGVKVKVVVTDPFVAR